MILSKIKFRFSLKILILLFAVLCTGIGLFVNRWNRARLQEEAVRRFVMSTDNLHYDYEKNGVDWLYGLYDTDPNLKPPVSPWWIEKFGIHFFTNVEDLFIEDNSLEDCRELISLGNLVFIYDTSQEANDLSILRRSQKLRRLFFPGSPIEDISSLAELSELEYLDLQHTLITDVKALCGLKKIYNLNLSNTEVVDVSPLRFLVNLEVLDIQYTKVTDISALGKLANLKTLNCRDVSIADLSPLSGLTNLESLTLTIVDDPDSKTQLPVDLTWARNLKKLKELKIDCPKLRSIDSIRELTSLTKLEINSNELIDINPLQELTHLNSLRLDCPKVVDVGSDWASRQIHDVYLNFPECEDFTFLGTQLELEKIEIAGGKICNLSFLKHIQKLDELELCKLKLKDLEPLRHCAIWQVSVSDCEIENFSALRDVKNVESLRLANTNFSDCRDLPRMINGQEGSYLDLSHTKISSLEGVPENLCLTSFSISGTEVSDISPLHKISFTDGWVDLSHTKIQNLAPLSNKLYFRHLDLEETFVTDLTPIFGFRELGSLRLSGTSVPQEQVDEMKRLLPSCTVFTNDDQSR